MSYVPLKKRSKLVPELKKNPTSSDINSDKARKNTF